MSLHHCMGLKHGSTFICSGAYMSGSDSLPLMHIEINISFFVVNILLWSGIDEIIYENLQAEMEMVGSGLKRHLTIEQRKHLLSLYKETCGADDHRSIVEALGLVSIVSFQNHLNI